MSDDVSAAQHERESSGETFNNQKRFRFKSEHNEGQKERDGEDGRKRRRHPHESSHRHRKRRRASPSDATRVPPSHPMSSLPPDQAFQESLFDAMGDDEGAAFWEGVYGQPIHNYPSTYQDQETGELEQMNDDEYATFVRRKMWEKSWEGIEAAREEQRREREREKKRIRQEDLRRQKEERAHQDYDVFDARIEASLRRGERRKDRRRWQDLWAEYLVRWEELRDLAQKRSDLPDTTEQIFLRNKIAWPLETGKRKDISREEIERFVRKGTSDQKKQESDDSFTTAIKAERVRWHPDKIQQRYGFLEIDEDTLKGVTAVFQVFDAIWNEVRERHA